ncbi:glycosyltransferase family 4 protein [Candidatus Kaiserbacteria bacterium]|nr:glycosyltransferase family 4 protein [Candidatus Kaiserbacteria bacterium]
MKIFVLTADLDVKNGWGRYSADLIGALGRHGAETVFIRGVLPHPLTYRTYFLAFWYAWKLRPYAKNCDVIHALIEPYSCIAQWLSLFTGKRYFITAHGTWAVLPFTFSRAKRYLHKKSFEQAEKVICVSEYTRRRLFALGLANLHVINNGINFEKFHDPALSLGGREDSIVTVGALNPAKGYDVSLAAFAKARAELKSLRYYIVGNRGNAAYFAALEQQAARLGVREDVIFQENLSHEELVKLYRKAKLFMLPSLTLDSDFEGFGLVYLEAGACGLPVIGSLDSGAEDAIINGETGLLVPQNDPHAVAEAILKIMKETGLAERMAESGVRWAKAHDWSAVVQSYVQAYALKSR